jgi:arylformamidase
MPVFDLTIPIYHGIESFPGEPGSFFVPFASIEGQGFLSHQMLLYSHGGTHVDAPRHFLQDGGDVAAMPLDRLMGSAMVVDVVPRGRSVQLSDIQWPREPKSGDRILLRTGWGKHWGQTDYFSAFPNLEMDVVRYLAQQGIAVLGLDTPTPNDEDPRAVHEILLGQQIILIEGLINLECIPTWEGVLICLPLPMVSLDGSPARVVFVTDSDWMRG